MKIIIKDSAHNNVLYYDRNRNVSDKKIFFVLKSMRPLDRSLTDQHRRVACTRQLNQVNQEHFDTF